jgi:hypothetical protein
MTDPTLRLILRKFHSAEIAAWKNRDPHPVMIAAGAGRTALTLEEHEHAEGCDLCRILLERLLMQNIPPAEGSKSMLQMDGSAPPTSLSMLGRKGPNSSLDPRAIGYEPTPGLTDMSSWPEVPFPPDGESVRPARLRAAHEFIASLRLPDDAISNEQLARAAWPLAVGTKIAARARAAQLIRNRLVVEVEDDLWLKNLFLLRQDILCNLKRSLGSDLVQELEFRIATLRKGPQRAMQSMPDCLNQERIIDEDSTVAALARRSVRQATKKLA